MKNIILSILLIAFSSISLIAQDLATATFVKNLKINTQEIEPEGFVFNDTGTKFYVIGRRGKLSEYHLTTAYEISTATYAQDFNASPQEINAKGIAFNTNGSKMYIIGAGGDDINEYALSTAYDVSTAVYTHKFSVKAQETAPNDLCFDPSGAKLFIIGRTGDDINEYALTTAYDVSTAVYVQNFSIQAQETQPSGLTFNSAGTKMYVIGTYSDQIQEYILTTAYDINTAGFSQNLDIKPQEGNSTGVIFGADNTQLFVIGKGGDEINEFAITPDIMDPDNDGDGVLASLDCDDSDPNLTTEAASCDDGNAGTENDVVTADCTCEGTIIDPDNDGDGVLASLDCNDNDPNLTTVGASCDDGDTNTENDLVTTACTCEGTPTGGGTGLSLWTDNTDYLSYDKRVLIGTTTKLPNGFGLYVQEGILAEKVKVALEDSDDWADYVFQENYPLKPIQEVAAFVKKHKHLPNVPSAAELANTGIDVAKMDATLLQQIEELWLHVIELKAENEALKKDNEAFKKQVIQMMNEK